MSAAIRMQHHYAVYVYCMILVLNQDGRSSQWCLSFRVSHRNPIRNPFPLAEKLLCVISNHVVGFYTYCAFKWLLVVRPRCKSMYHDIVLRCVGPCHLAVGMFCGYQRRKSCAEERKSALTASEMFQYQRPHKQSNVKH